MSAATATAVSLLAEQAVHPIDLDALARQGGTGVVRLRPEWGPMLRGFAALGRVRALTGNRVAVLERDGRFGEAAPGEQGIQFAGGDLDLTVRPGEWAWAFAVARPGREAGHVCRSLRFFDWNGDPAHQVRLRKESDLAGFEALVEEFVDPQAGEVMTAPAGRPAELRSGAAERVRQLLAAAAEEEIALRWEILNGACRKTAEGRIHKLSEGDEGLLAMGQEFRVRIQPDEVDGVTAEADGAVTLHDEAGQPALRLSLATTAIDAMRRRWQELTEAVCEPALAGAL